MAIILIIIYGIFTFFIGLVAGAVSVKKSFIKAVNQQAYATLDYKEMETFKTLFKKLEF